jgi:hypothetical protein
MMRQFAFIVLVAGCGNNEQCAVDTPCSPGSANHYQFCNGGGVDDCLYLTGDGHKFHCTTCGDCTDARSLVTDWCDAQATVTTNHSQMCTSAACPTGSRSYSFCSSTGATACTYKGSDGTAFNCNSCSDCSAAAQEIAQWCSGSSTTSSGGGDSVCFGQATNACQTCCASNHTDGAAVYAQAYLSCGCGTCASTSCTTAGDVCHGGSSQTSDCASCLSGAQQSCASQISAACSGSAACGLYLACVQRC